MSFDSDYSEMSPVENNPFNKKESKLSAMNSKINNSAPVKKMFGSKQTKPGTETRIIETVPLIILQVVLIMVLKNVWDIRKRCKCDENKNLATVLVVLYTLLILVTGGSITAVLIGYPMDTVKKAIPGAMIGIFIITIMMTFAYIYKVEDKCDCPQTDNIYNLIKLYFGFLGFLFISSMLVYGFSYALD